MPKDYKELDQQLAAISGIIDEFIDNSSEFPSQIRDIERWLQLQKERITAAKFYSNKNLHVNSNDGMRRTDGIIVFDANLDVMNYSGPGNYFFGSDFDHCKKLSLRNFLSETDVNKIRIVLGQNTLSKENNFFECLIKTGPGTSAFCMLKIIKFSGNDGHFMALLKFPNNPEQLLNTYQNIILESLPGMDIYLIDRDYRYIIAAGEEKQRHGFTNTNIVGKTLFEVVDKKSQRSLFPFYNKALNGIATEGEVRFKDQVYYIISRPIEIAENETIAGIIIVQNVTSDKLLEQQLRRRKDEAQKSDRTKSIFIANLSHEMRTPLNAIMGFSDQLNKTSLTDHQANLVSLTRTSSSHLLYLVNEVVFLFKLGMGKVFIEKTPFALNDLVMGIHAIMLPKAEEKQLDFTVKLDDSCPDLLMGDPFRLRQIIINLVVNALKFTDEGSVVLSCKIKKQEKDSVVVAFSVQDTGIGIKKEDLPTIFNVFEQGATRADNMRGGAGLGLGICQKLTSLLDGEIVVKSKVGAGSTFTVSIPFEKVTDQIVPSPERKYSISDNLLAGKKIFLADDDQHNLLLSELIFKRWKVDFHLAPDGKKAFEILDDLKFDIILLDIQMPGKTGLEIVESIRSNRDHLNYSTPMVSISANVLKSDIRHYLETGFNDYLTKPFQEEEMYNVMCSNILNGQPSAYSTNAYSAEVSLPADEINLTQLKKTAAGDKTFEKTVLQNFRDQSFVLSENFNVLLKSQNWKKIGEKAHKAIPSFKYFGLGETAALLTKIEQKALREHEFSNLYEMVKQSNQRIFKLIEQFDQLLEEMKKNG